jgi:FemAB-related protein (PEP-CTERM system-associated)
MNEQLTTQVTSDLRALLPNWDDYALAHPEGTIFHLLGWARVLEKTFQYKPFYCIARRKEGICGILPLFRVRNLPFGHSLVSLPLAVYGGIRADDGDAAQALLVCAQQLATEMKVRFLELRHEVGVGKLPTKDLYVTFRKEIFSDEEKNLAAIPRKQRRMARQGEKFGLESRLGGEELLNDFYRVYSESVRSLGTPVFPFRLFEQMLMEFGTNCQILGVFREGRMAAGVMTLFFRDQVMPYYGGALASELRYAVNDFMYWKLLCYGAERGYKVFDFGRSKKRTGAYDFKRHWGFEPTPLAYEYVLGTVREMPNLSPANPKFALPIEIWKRLPLPVTQWLGPKLIQFFP